jgi:uncharacterized membrane protein YgcG
MIKSYLLKLSVHTYPLALTFSCMHLHVHSQVLEGLPESTRRRLTELNREQLMQLSCEQGEGGACSSSRKTGGGGGGGGQGAGGGGGSGAAAGGAPTRHAPVTSVGYTRL